MPRLRRALVNLAGAFLIALIYSAATEASFEAMKWMFAAPFVALIVGAIGDTLRTFTRYKPAGQRIVRLALIILLAFPASFASGPLVVRVDVWRTKRWVESDLRPRLEEHRRQHGSYPRRLRFHDRHLGYGSDGANYWLWTMDPLVCGRVWTYASTTREWRESHDPCYY